jgi:ParB-like chromosome segregation protein Spo0J
LSRGVFAMRSIRQVEVDFIETERERRPVNRDDVDMLAVSFVRIGMQMPITVRCFPDRLSGAGAIGTYVLVTGAHRLAAAKQLGWPTIDCFIADCDEIEAQLLEISENLHRRELTALERAEQIALWVDLVNRKPVQPEQVSIGGRGNKGGEAQASRKLGFSRPDIHRAVKVAALAPEAKEAASAAGLENNRSALLESAKKKTMAAQVNVIKGIAASKQDTRKKKKGRKPRFVAPKSTPEQRDEFDLQGLQALWETASDNARAAFLKSVRPPLRASRAAICDRVREAVLILSGQPPAHEVVGWFANNDGASLISETIRPAAAWLADFAAAWPEEFADAIPPAMVGAD